MNSYHKLIWQGQNVKLIMKDTSVCSNISYMGSYMGVVNKNGTILIKSLKDSTKINLKIPFKRDPSTFKYIFISEDGKYAVLVTKENIILWDSELIRDQFRIIFEMDKGTTNDTSFDVVFYENSKLGKGCKIAISYCSLMNSTVKKSSLTKQVSSTKFFKNQITETQQYFGVDEYFLKSSFQKQDQQITIMNDNIEKDVQSKNPYLFNVVIDIQLSIKEPNYSIKIDKSYIKVPKTIDSPSECLNKWDKDGQLLSVIVNSPEPELYFYSPFQSLSICIQIFKKEDMEKELTISPIKDMSWTNDGLFLILINTKGMISILPRLGETAYINKEKQIGNICKESERSIYNISCHPISQSFLITNGRKFSFYQLPDVDITNLIYSYTRGENNSLFNLKNSQQITMNLFRIIVSIPNLENYLNYHQSLNDLFDFISNSVSKMKSQDLVNLFEDLFVNITWGKGNIHILIPHYIKLFEKIFDKMIEKQSIDLTIQLLIYCEKSVEKMIKEVDKDVIYHKTIEKPNSYLHEIWIKIANKLEENLEKKNPNTSRPSKKLSDDNLLQGVITKLKQSQPTKNLSFFELTKFHNLDEKKNNTLRKAFEKYLHGDFKKASEKFFKIQKKKYVNAGFICLLLSNELNLCFKYLESKIGFNFTSTTTLTDNMYQDIISLMANLIEYVYDSKEVVILSPLFCFDQICDLIYENGNQPKIKGYFVKLNLIQKQFEQLNYKGNIINLSILLWQSIGKFDQIIRLCLKYSFYFKFFQNNYVQEKSVQVFIEMIEKAKDYLFIDKVFNLTETFSFNSKKQILKAYLDRIKKDLICLDYRKMNDNVFIKKSLFSCLNYLKNEKDLFIKYQENNKDEKIHEYKYLLRYIWNIELIERFKGTKMELFDQESLLNLAHVTGQMISFSDLHSLEISLGIFFGYLFLLKRPLTEKLLSKYITKESIVLDTVKGQFSRLKEGLKITFSEMNQEWLYENEELFWKFIKEKLNTFEEYKLSSLIKKVNEFKRLEAFTPTLSKEDLEKILLKDFNYQTYKITETLIVDIPVEPQTPRIVSNSTQNIRKSTFSKMMSLIKGGHTRSDSKTEEDVDLQKTSPRKDPILLIPKDNIKKRKSIFSSFLSKDKNEEKLNIPIDNKSELNLSTTITEVTPRKKLQTDDNKKKKEEKKREEKKKEEERKREEERKKEDDEMQFLEI